MPNEHDDLTPPPSSETETDPTGAPEGSPAPLVSAEELQALVDERNEAQNQYLRLLAEFQTFRRRTEQEKQELRKVATEGLVQKLLPVLDNFERTVAGFDAGMDPESLRQGILMVEVQLRNALGTVELERVKALGEPFDPELHEAIAVDHTDDAPPETVTAEIEAGYRLAGKVIRPARVRIAQAPQ